MAYNQEIADRVRGHLAVLQNDVEEKEMMGGIAFMYNAKMVAGVIKDDLFCRLDPENIEHALQQNGCRTMDMKGRPMKGWVFVEYNSIRSQKELAYWINLALDFNAKAKSYKKNSAAKKASVRTAK